MPYRSMLLTKLRFAANSDDGEWENTQNTALQNTINKSNK
jgi:hypothetical protein